MTLDSGSRGVPTPRSPLPQLSDEALYHALIDSLPDITLFVFGPDLRYRVVAGGGHRRSGWRSDDIVGRRPSDILPDPDGLELESHMRAALHGETRTHEHAGVRDSMAYWSSTLAPIRDESGQIVGGMVLSRNIAGMREAERLRRVSEQRFDVALAAAPVLVFAQDAELRFTWANKTWVTESPELLYGKTDEDVLSLDVVDQTVPAKRRVLATGRRERLLFEAESRTGGTRYFDMTLEPSRDASGDIDGIVGAVLDVTELRVSEQRLQAALEAMLDSVTIQEPLRDESGEIVDFRITFATTAAVDFAGRRRDELIGRTVAELYPGLEDGFLGAYAHVCNTGEPIRMSAIPYVDDDGQERLYDVAVSKLGDELLVVWREVTEREAERATAARADALRATSEELQQGLLPPAPPPIAGWSFGATYRPANETAEVGGDWYAVTPIDGDGVDLVVGDVEGHDGVAAALMARLSAVLSAGSQRRLSLAALVAETRSFHASLGTERLATLLVARLHRADGRVTLTSAGHPSPLVLRSDALVDRVWVDPSAPIGADDGSLATTELTIEAGDTLVLFSDGLLDPQLDSDDAMTAIARVAREHAQDDPQSLADALADATRTYRPSDDVVVLAVRRL
jgi:PAS domain S-box-containing protein